MRQALLFTVFLLGSSFLSSAKADSPFAPFSACLTCNVPDGLVVSDLTGTSATLSWTAVAGATSYEVEVEDEQNNPSTFQIETTVSGTSYAVTGLTPGVLYKFKVRARCGSDKSDWSDWTFFTATLNPGGGSGTGGGGGTGACSIPINLTVNVLSGVTTLTWDSVPGATQYWLEIEDEQNPNSTFHLEVSTTTNSYVATGLTPGVLYKFKVRANCSDWSGWVFFDAAGGGGGSGGGGSTGTCVAPQGLTVSVSGGTATLSWQAVAGAVQYEIEVEDEQNSNSNFHLETTVQDTFYVLSGLPTGVLLKFKVRSHCGGGNQSDWSGWVFFNGNTSGQGGGSGSCNRPTGLQASDLTTTSAQLSWNAVAGAVSYTVEIKRERHGSWEMVQVVDTNLLVINNLTANRRYRFRVRTNCADGDHSGSSKWVKFKTPHNFQSGDDTSLSTSAMDRSMVSTPLEAPAFSVNVGPNPTPNTTTVRVRWANSETASLRLFDLTGRQVLEQKETLAGGGSEVQLDLSALRNGCYLLQVSSGQQRQTVRVVVAH